MKSFGRRSVDFGIPEDGQTCHFLVTVCLLVEDSIMTNVTAWMNHETEKVRSEFLQVLKSRRKESVALRTILGVHRDLPYLQRERSLLDAPAIDSGPGGATAISEPNYKEENFFLITEAGEQGRLPVLLLRPIQKNETRLRRPAVVFLHSTGRSKEVMRPYMEAFAARGYVAVAIDSRYHGERASSEVSYENALVSAWRSGDEMPFIFDTRRRSHLCRFLSRHKEDMKLTWEVWDLIKLVDYLSHRQDVDPERIGMLGVSLGGMHAWFAAVADPRIAAVVPIIGVQSFRWAVHNEKWHARVQSIPHVFEVAKEDLGKSAVDAETVLAVWQRIAPGLIDKFDADRTIPAIAPRPLLIINGELDPRCPLKGLEETLAKAAQVYDSCGFPEHFKFKTEEGVEHTFIESMGYDASIWLDRFLKPDQSLGYVPEQFDLDRD